VKLAAPDGTEVLGHDSSGRPKVSFLATANERGFFQIVGAPPGSYLVVAEEPARGRAETTATVSARNETWINPAIQLEPAASVTFDLTPPLSPAGTPWSLQLLYARNGQQVSHAYPKHKVTEAGRLQVPRLLPGTYRVLVRGRSNPADRVEAVWSSSLVDVNEGHATELINIDVSGVDLCGTVLLGDDGLRARLTAHEMMSGFETSGESDDAGDFCLILPRPAPSLAATSFVDFGIVSDEPPVNVGVRKWVHLQEANPTVRIELGARTLRGTVVDEDGQPSTAHVTAKLGASVAGEMDTAEDGRFSFHGLEGDPVRVEAWGPKGAAKAVLAEPKVLDDSDSDSDSASDELRLVLHATTTRTARVTSLGAPVPGALVLMMPLDFLASPRAMPLQNTDEHGVFEFGVPISARAFGFLVSARGRPVRLGRAEMPPGQWAEGVPLEIQLPQESGTLVITDIPGVVLGEPEGLPLPVVVHGGFWFYAENLSTAGATRQGQTFTLLVEPGHYAICQMTPLQVSMLQSAPPLTGCSSADLPPGGSITLRASTQEGAGSQTALGGQR
jgi:hypothetical protein